MCIPINGQYEQKCNAATLKDFGVLIAEDVDKNFTSTIINWLHLPHPKKIEMKYSTEVIVDLVIQQIEALRMQDH